MHFEEHDDARNQRSLQSDPGYDVHDGRFGDVDLKGVKFILIAESPAIMGEGVARRAVPWAA